MGHISCHKVCFVTRPLCQTIHKKLCVTQTMKLKAKRIPLKVTSLASQRSETNKKACGKLPILLNNNVFFSVTPWLITKNWVLFLVTGYLTLFFSVKSSMCAFLSESFTSHFLTWSTAFWISTLGMLFTAAAELRQKAGVLLSSFNPKIVPGIKNRFPWNMESINRP